MENSTMDTKNYGLDFFKGLSQPFEKVSDNSTNGMTLSEGQHIFAYDAGQSLAAPEPSNLQTPTLVHIFGVCKDFANDLYEAYRVFLLDRSKILDDVDALRRHADMAYEENKVINYVAHSSEALLTNDELFFKFYDGIGTYGVHNVSLAFSIALQHVMENGKPYRFTTYEVFHTTIGSYIDTFDGYNEFEALNMVPAATPRLIVGNRELGAGGERADTQNDYALVIPLPVEPADDAS